MTRKSRREIERDLDTLEATRTVDGEPIVLVVPDVAVSTDPLPDDVDRAELPEDEITVTDPESGVSKPAIPVQKKARLSGVACIPERQIAYWWATMSADVRERERQLREQRGAPLPPLLEGDA